MSWNYRVIKTVRNIVIGKDKSKLDIVYRIHEVYYDENNNIRNWTEDGVDTVGETKKELIEVHNEMKKAFDMPILIKENGKLVELKE
jgi:hypothetical protein